MADPITSALLGAGSPRNAYIKALISGGLDTSPIRSPWQGAARMAQALLGGLAMREDDQKTEGLKAATMRMIDSSIGGGGGQTPPIAQTGGPAMGGDYNKAISGIESGGKYDATGPVTKTGDRAYGKYQVMGANIPAWTKAHLGQEMTPDQFIANPQAQEAVFKGQFGQYAQKYGPEGAAKAWFAGERGMNNPNARDQLGTTVAQYGQKFTQALGPQAQQPPQAPQGGPQPQIRTPQLTPQQRQDLAIIMQENPAVGYELLKKYTTPKEQFVDLTPEERARAQIPQGVPAQKDLATGKYSIGQPMVSVNNQSESSFEKNYGEGMSKRAISVIDSGDKASHDIQNVQMLRGLLQNIQTGKMTPAQSTMGAWMQSIGMDPSKFGIDPSLPASAEAATTLINKFALSNIGGEGGIPANNFSEADRDFILKLVPNLRNRPEANGIILAAKEREAELAIKRADAWAEARSAGISYEKFEREWRKSVPKDIFKDLAEQAKTLQPAQATPAGAPSIDDLVKKYSR